MMRSLAILCFTSLNTLSLNAQVEDTLFLVYRENTDMQGYVNKAGDTIIPVGTYQMCFTEVFTDFAVVLPYHDSEPKLIGIDRSGDELFEVMWYDNGPDFLVDDRFRIIMDGRIGYANSKGEVVIQPEFACAEPFENGVARVAYDCEENREGEYTFWVSSNWLYINTEGDQVPAPE